MYVRLALCTVYISFFFAATVQTGVLTALLAIVNVIVFVNLVGIFI